MSVIIITATTVETINNSTQNSDYVHLNEDIEDLLIINIENESSRFCCEQCNQMFFDKDRKIYWCGIDSERLRKNTEAADNPPLYFRRPICRRVINKIKKGAIKAVNT